MNDIWKRAHVTNHAHGRCVVGALFKILHEGSIWAVPRVVVFFTLHKPIFIYFLHYGKRFYDKYIKSDEKKKYIDDYGSCIFPKKGWKA